MLPNYHNISNFSDQALYTLQERVPPPLPAETQFTSEPQLKQRKRSCRADRHSKIRTAHGERDRRMRLSVQVAHQFFALQDQLGFDKASKTIDWLLTQAKDSINQLSFSSSSSELPKEETQINHAIITDSEPLHATEREREKKVVTCKLDQVVPAASASTSALMEGNCDDMEYYYYLLNEILNGGICSVEIEDGEGASSSGGIEFN